MSSIKLYLIRHGESIANASAQTNGLIGQSEDEPLTLKGKKQAQKLGSYLMKNIISFDEVYVSNYKRAHDTCRIVKQFYQNNPFEEKIVPEIREYSPGDMCGTKRSETMTPEVITAMENLGMLFKFPNGESLYEVQQRAINWLYTNVLSIHSESDRTVALFSHGMTIKSILQYIMQFDQRMTWAITLDNTSMSILEFKNSKWFLKCINSTPHLVKDF